jgi:hypothetical protein
MAEFNPNSTSSVNLPMNDIIKMFASLLIPTIKLPNIPPALILTGAQFRGGLSPRKIASRIITRQHEAGAPQGPLSDGSESVTEKMELIRLEEIIYAIQNEAKVEVTVKPGQQVDGTFAGIGSGYIKGVTITTGKGNAIIR